MNHLHDARIRSSAFNWLASKVEEQGEVLSRQLLAQGFMLDDVRVPLVGPQGIFKPQVLRNAPISITTSPESPYSDNLGPDGLLQYRYRGTDPQHRDNLGLKYAMTNKIPLIYFFGVSRGKYLAFWPVFVVGDDQQRLTFSVAVDDPHTQLGKFSELPDLAGEPDSARRRYITSSVRVRLHQRTFRERVLDAYRRSCAFCGFRHEEMLNAAHIVPDSDPEGEPVISNGLSLCSLHHAAFDQNFLGLRPDFTLEVRPDILKETDGPTLVHGIQALQDSRILLPRDIAKRPDRNFVEKRYSKFKLSH